MVDTGRTVGRKRVGSATATPLELGACILATVALACNGKTFSATGSGGGAGTSPSGGRTGGEAGSVAHGGSGGTGTAGGPTGASGAAGRGGSGGAGAGGAPHSGGEAGDAEAGEASGAGGDSSCDDASSCGDGRYCGADGHCRSCTDLTTLEHLEDVRFGTPVPFSIVNAAAGDFALRTPRAFGSSGALLYVREFFGGELWLTGDPDRDIGAPLASPVNEPDSIEGAPVWFEQANGELGSYGLVFGRAAATGTAAEFYATTLRPNGTAGTVTRLPAPFNSEPPLSESTYSMAVSRERAWWMVNRDLVLALQFLTAPLDQSGPPSVVPLRHTESCNVSEFDVSAWVTPDGKLLFASAHERNADCSALEGEPRDVLMFRLDEAGQAVGRGTPVAGVSRPGTNELDGSLSPDLCTMYFVGDEDGRQRLMRSRRER
jgi:hypothetical protein